MSPKQFDQFKAAVVAAVDKHIADGGKLMQYSFGFGKTICPLSCVAQRTPYEDTLQALDRSLGFEMDHEEMWDFIYGFDGTIKNETIIPDSESFRFGQEMRRKYADHILPVMK